MWVTLILSVLNKTSCVLFGHCTSPRTSSRYQLSHILTIKTQQIWLNDWKRLFHSGEILILRFSQNLFGYYLEFLQLSKTDWLTFWKKSSWRYDTCSMFSSQCLKKKTGLQSSNTYQFCYMTTKRSACILTLLKGSTHNPGTYLSQI